jgi:hypothetical protein
MMTKTILTAVSVVCAASLLAPATALAQKQGYQTVDPSERATYGDYRLNAGFPDDPYTIYVTSGGNIDASGVASDCVGMVSRAPDAQVTYSAGSLPLIIRTEASTDTTLLINGPDGRWYCDDDSGGGTNAEISWSNPGSGVYDIWVGAYAGNSGEARLMISELYTGGNNVSADTTYDSGATFGEVSLRAGFSPDPHTVPLTAGGDIEASSLGGQCTGQIADNPDYIVNYQAGSFPLIFGVDSERDTTLVIADWNDRIWCDDDGGSQSLNPRVQINNPRSGDYRVWVGTYSAGNAPATLYVTELSSNAP